MKFDFHPLYSTYTAVIAKMPRRQPDEAYDFDSHDFIREWSHDNQETYIQALSAYHQNDNPFMIVHGLLAQGLNQYPMLVQQAGEISSTDIFGRNVPCMSWKRVKRLEVI